MENIDIKDFSSVSAVNDTDNILLTHPGGNPGKMKVNLFKQAVIEGLSPNVRDGVWYVGDKNLNVQAEGKTPVLETGTTTTLEPGQNATSEVVANGTDDAGNPKYKLNFGIPKGYDGAGGSGGGGMADSVQWANVLNKPSWVNSATKPTYTASEVGALPAATVIPSKTSQLSNDSGFTTSASFKTINGQSIVGSGNIAIEGGGGDTPSTGGGNVNVTNGASLEMSKQYAFKPQAAGSVMGTFVEVEASGSVDITDIYNRIAEADNGGTVSEEDFNTLKGYIEAGSTLYVNNDGNGCLVNYIYSSGFYLIIYLPYSTSGLMYNIIYISEERRITVTGKIVPFMDIISNMNLNDYEKPSSYSPISSTDSIQSAIGKLEYKVTEEGGSDDTYWVVGNNLIGLGSGATHEEILTALGGDIEPITNAVIAGKKVFIRYNLVDSLCLTIPVSAYVVVTGVIRFLFTLPNVGYMIDLLCSTTAPAQSYVKIIYLSGYILDGSFATLTQESDSQAISDAVGGESGMKKIIHAVNDGNRLVVRGTTGMNIDLLCFGALEKENGDMNISVSAIGYGLFGGVISYVIIDYIKSNDLFTISVVNLY